MKLMKTKITLITTSHGPTQKKAKMTILVTAFMKFSRLLVYPNCHILAFKDVYTLN
jgi:hypothetical protein